MGGWVDWGLEPRELDSLRQLKVVAKGKYGINPQYTGLEKELEDLFLGVN